MTQPLVRGIRLCLSEASQGSPRAGHRWRMVPLHRKRRVQSLPRRGMTSGVLASLAFTFLAVPALMPFPGIPGSLALCLSPPGLAAKPA